MSNNKDFLLKNAVEVSGPTKTTVGTITSSDVDLSTGNYFVDTPTGVSTYTFSNPADVQAFQMEVTGGTEEAASVFSTTLYTGTGAEQTITNDIDLAGDGGLVWIKDRTGTGYNALFDTERGFSTGLGYDSYYKLESNGTNAQTQLAYGFQSMNSNGFTIGYDNGAGTNGCDNNLGLNGNDFVSWTFKKEPNFFDVVTYTGDGVSGKTVSHNLGADVGTLIVKKTNSTDNWFVWHRGLTDATYRIMLNSTSAETQQTNAWNSTAPTSTEFTLGDNGNTNASGDSYVAYLFAHDTAADGLIQCGSYTGGGETDVTVNLGWQPQWLFVRRSDASEDWFLLDTARGLGADGDPNAILKANLSDAESSSSTRVALTSTGFQTTANTGSFNASGGNYIYIAIRAASEPDITWPSSIEWSGGTAPSAPATGETDLYTFVTDDSGTSYIGLKSASNLS